MNTPTPTPRTDAAWSATFDGEQMSAGRTARALREFSQRMETELATLRAERDQLRADCENETKWAAHYLAQSIADKARAERAEAEAERYRLVTLRLDAELAKERARLKEMAAELAHCAGYIASVRTDRQITWHEELYALQTVVWAEGAVEIAEKANAVLESHDAAIKKDTK